MWQKMMTWQGQFCNNNDFRSTSETASLNSCPPPPRTPPVTLISISWLRLLLDEFLCYKTELKVVVLMGRDPYQIAKRDRHCRAQRDGAPGTTPPLTARTACGRCHGRWRRTGRHRNRSARLSEHCHLMIRLSEGLSPWDRRRNSEFGSYITSVLSNNRYNIARACTISLRYVIATSSV